MDLLVHLIKKAEVDIYDIPISRDYRAISGISGMDAADEH
jgi:hypothetical protein